MNVVFILNKLALTELAGQSALVSRRAVSSPALFTLNRQLTIDSDTILIIILLNSPTIQQSLVSKVKVQPRIIQKLWNLFGGAMMGS